MFSDELQMLIDAAIADGEITEKERQLLHKRAEAEGVDVDELDMIVDAKIQQLKKKESNSNPGESGETALQKLLRTIEGIEKGEYQGSESEIEIKKNDDTINAIRNLYLPQDRSQLLELFSFMKTYNEKDTGFWSGMDGYEIEIVKAYKDKYKEVCEKMKMLFPNDSEIASLTAAAEPAAAPAKKKGFFSKLFG